MCFPEDWDGLFLCLEEDLDRDLWRGTEMNAARNLIIVKLPRNKLRKKMSIK